MRLPTALIVALLAGAAQRAIDWSGGETPALARLKHYLWDTGAISEYFNTRNGMLGPDYSTKFSPWLALGCLSPRTIHQEVCLGPSGGNALPSGTLVYEPENL